MKIVVIGGTGLIGSKVCKNLQELGHEAYAASPSTGVNVINGEGLTQALKGADVVVDVANSPSFEDHAALHFFKPPGTTCSRRRSSTASNIMSPCPSSALSGCSTAVTSGRKWRRKR